ncbi:MAG: glycosyltransferase, partial [Verrucomicrobiota bacterium]
MNILIACGGTGGHLFPGLAVAETLAARRHQVKLLVSDKAVDQAALS